MNIYVWILSLAIVAGQLIKFPLGLGGITLADISIIALSLYGFSKLNFNFNRITPFFLAALIFILVATISLLLTPLHLQFNEYLASFAYTLRFSFYVLFGYLVYCGAFNNFKNPINNALIFSGVGLAILGSLQFIFLPDLGFLTKLGWDPHYFRTVSTFLDPNFAGAYFVLTLLLLTSLRGNKVNVAMTVVYLALLTTFSRSSYLMFFVSFLTLSFLQKSKKLLIKTCLLFIILLLGFQVYSQLVSQPRNIDREQSASSRLNTWQQGLQLFQTYPILGVGFNAYKYALKEFNLGDEQFLNSHGATSNDSSLLFVASTTGILGLSSYLLFLVWIIKTGLKNNVSLAAAALGLLIHSIFANSLFYPPIFLWLIITYASPKK